MMALLHRALLAQNLRYQLAIQTQYAGMGMVRNFSAAKPDMALIKELRAASGAPIKDVKAALEEGGWDMDAAFAALRKKGLAAAAKKGDRTTLEGLVGLAEGGNRAAMVEVNCETDFVARNDKFQSLLGLVAQAALDADPSAVDPTTSELSADGIAAVKVPSGMSINEAVADVAGTMRENMQFRRAFLLHTTGVVGSYLHTSPSPGLGRIGAMVALEAADGSSLDGEGGEKVRDLGKKLAMHVVAAKPQFLDRHSVTPEALEAEKKMLTEQAAATGKPANIIEKMVMGRMGKYYEEFCLLDQKYVMDDGKSISAVVKEMGKEVGKELKLTKYVRIGVGEGKTGGEEAE